MPGSNLAAVRVDHIGSLMRPKRLLDARYSETPIEPARLTALEDECIREVIALQEGLGLQIVSDGEFRRESWRSSFIGRVEGLEHRDAQAQVNATKQVDMGSFVMDAAPFVVGRLRRKPIGIVCDELRFLKSHTTKTAKVALPAPSFMHFFSGAGAVDRSAYPNVDEFYADLVNVYIEEIQALAALGAGYVQLDEAPLGFLSDAGVRARMASAGIDAFDWVELYVDMLNAVIAAAPPSVTIGVHVCRGNSMGQAGGTGSFELVAQRVFGKLRAHRLLLEFDEPHNGDLSPLRFVADHAMVVIGLVSTKRTERETADWLAKRVHDATAYLPLDRLCISPQCGFSSRDKGTSLSVDDQVAKLSTLVETAGRVWC